MAQNQDNNGYGGQNGAGYNGRYRGEEIGSQYNFAGLNTADDNNDEIDLKQIFGLLWHNKLVIIVITFVFGVGAFFYAQSQIPIYESSGSLQISEAGMRYSMAGSDLSNLMTSNFGIGMGSTIENEIHVLQSRQFANELTQRIYDERFQPDGRMYPLLWREYPQDSSIVARDTVFSRLYGFVNFNRADRNSNLLRISFRSPSPYEAARIVDMAIETYSDVSTRINRSQARSAIVFLQGELEKVDVQLNQSEEDLREFMNQNGLIKLDEQAGQIINALATLEAERQMIQVKLVSVTAALDSYTAELDKLTPGLAANLTASIAPRLNNLQFFLAERETQRTLLLARNPILQENPNDPAISELNRQIDGIKAEIGQLSNELINSDAGLSFFGTSDGNVSNRFLDMRNTIVMLEIERQQFEAQQSLLSKRITDYQTFFDDLPDNMIEMARYQRNLQISETLYLLISQQAAETALWEQTQSGLARVVDMSYLPDRPVAPRKLFILLIGLLVGGILGVGYVSLREFLKVEVSSIDKLLKKGYQMLAIIPDMTKHIKDNFDGSDYVSVRGNSVSTSLTMVLDSISPISESFRRLQSNVIYSQPDNPLKTIIVTSANKSEGKSTVSTNLCIALAEAGKKVLLVDCDFRRPRAHAIFGLEQEPGSMEVLFGNLAPELCIKNTLVANVDVLTSGKRPPNPAEITRSAKLRELIRQLKTMYDHVVIDSPPFGIISDAAPLIQESDGVVLVCRFNQTKSPELDLTIDNLKKVKANVIGTVMTAFDPKKSTGYYYSSYYYKYAYESYDKYHEEA
jgi:capsular exopolysaccharide synthesis family protein